MELSDWLGRLANELQGPTCLQPPGVSSRADMPDSCLGSGDLTSGPCLSAASTVLVPPFRVLHLTLKARSGRCGYQTTGSHG